MRKLTAAQAEVLEYVTEEALGVSSRDVSEWLGHPRGTATNRLQALAAKGLVHAVVVDGVAMYRPGPAPASAREHSEAWAYRRALAWVAGVGRGWWGSSTLADALQLPARSARRLLAQLADDGLVERQAIEGRRAHAYRSRITWRDQ